MIGLMMVGMVSAQDNLDIIEMNSSYVGEFTSDQSSVTVGFDGQMGDVIYIVALDNFVPVEFVLYSPNGGQLALSDNTLIRNIELGSAGRYTVQFTRPEWSEDEGEFTAFIGHYELASMGIEDEGATLSYNGNLSDVGALRQVQAEMTEGELATIQVFGANVGLTVQAPDGEFLVFEGVYDDPLVPLFQFPTTGTYIITVQTVEPAGTDISLYIYRHDPLEVAINEPIAGQLEENLPAVFAFESPADKMWDINASLPLNGDGFLGVYQFGDRETWETMIEADYGSGPDGQPRIRPFIPVEDGTYYFALWYDDWDTDYEAYDFELMVSPSTLLSIPNNSPITGEITNDTGDAQYAYSGKAGDQITVSINRLSDEGVISMAIYSAEDEVVTFTGRNASSGRFEVELPLDGIYQFVIFNASYEESSTLKYEILVELAQS